MLLMLFMQFFEIILFLHNDALQNCNAQLLAEIMDEVEWSGSSEQASHTKLTQKANIAVISELNLVENLIFEWF